MGPCWLTIWNGLSSCVLLPFMKLSRSASGSLLVDNVRISIQGYIVNELGIYACPFCMTCFNGKKKHLAGDPYHAIVHTYQADSSGLWTVVFHLRYKNLTIETQSKSTSFPNLASTVWAEIFYIYIEFLKAPRFYLNS